jgi:N-acetylglucosaminyl-diphospho-decaprenol L-rhamnosyltransferase
VTTPDARLGIVSWNSAPLLDRCLASLPAALGGLAVEVVVVDNDSDDGSADVAAAHPSVTVIRNGANVGYAAAMNRALADTAAPVLIALNPDTEPPAGSLAALVAELDRRPDVGLVVPRLVGTDGRVQHSVHRFPSVGLALATAVPRSVRPQWFIRRFRLDGDPADASGAVDWAFGAVHVLRAAALDGRPPYDERWFMYAEDIDLCWRLWGAGWKVHLAADVVIPHVGDASAVAGRAARAWGAAYDFQARARGRARARAWAGTNVLVAGTHWAVHRLAGHRHVAAELRAALPVHLAAARGRISPPAPPPGAP